MVVFTCQHCGDAVKKPKVAVHYQQKCRKAPFLTCVDCHKDFRDDEYVAHTTCITEAERYGAKDYVPKPSANKGERKQQEWTNVVNNLLNGTVNLSNAERSFLNILSNYDNVPRKKTKFLNFVRNAIGNRANATVVESVWDKMENAHKQSRQAPAKSPEKDTVQNQEQSKDEKTSTQNVNSNNSVDNQNIAENQNNENLCKENHSVSHQNEGDKACEMTNGLFDRRNKSKKRQLEPLSIQLPEEDQTAAKNRKRSVSETSDSDVSRFRWKQTILEILEAKGEIPLRKLRDKVMKRCIYYVFSLNDNTFKLTEYEKAIAKFNKTMEKLKESSAICISLSDNKVKLVK